VSSVSSVHLAGWAASAKATQGASGGTTDVVLDRDIDGVTALDFTDDSVV
jgi:hypothetical protein